MTDDDKIQRRREYCRKYAELVRSTEKGKEYLRNYQRTSGAKLAHRIAQQRYASSAGYGVYEATYGDKIYIGSGKLAARKIAHLTGNDQVSRRVGRKADCFKVLLICSKENSLIYEQKLIDLLGITYLLNQQRARST